MAKAPRSASNRGGRPPGGLRPGEQTSRYPQFVTRVPQEVIDTLRAAARVRRRPQWRVLTEAITLLVDQLPEDERKLLAELMQRAGPVFTQPSRGRVVATRAAAILNVDDHEPMRFARSRILEAEGYTVFEAGTGQEALLLAEQRMPDLILLDVNLPDMSGLEVSRRIRGNPRLRSVKIVHTSATFSTTRDQLTGLTASGADIYLAEPVPRGTLLSLVRRLLAV